MKSKIKAKTIKRALSVLVLFLIAALPAFAVPNGALAPDFTLKGTDGKEVSLKDFKGKVVVLEWFNSGCPFVVKQYKDGHMQRLQKELSEKGVVWLTINSTNANHENFLTPEKAEEFIKTNKATVTASLGDADGKVGMLYTAKTTPHMFVIDPTGTIVYQGAIDDRPEVDQTPEGAKNYVKNAVEEVMTGKPVTIAQTMPYGCSVKYPE